MSKEAPPGVSDWDREYMRRIGRYKHESHEDAIRRHSELPGGERLTRSIEAMFWSVRFRPPVDRDDPSPLYERARKLGLYRA